MSTPIRPKVSGKIISGIDQCVVKYVLKPPAYIRKRSSPECLPHKERLAAADEFIKAYLPEGGRPKNKEAFFKKAQNIKPTSIYSGLSSFGVHMTDLTWPSRFLPYWQDHHLSDTLTQLKVDRESTFLEKFFKSQENLRCYARRFRLNPNESRPTIICFHGYGGGGFAIENWSFTIKHLIKKFDIMLIVLPHHSFRKQRSRRYLPPRFPSADPRFTIEALRQVYYDYQGIKAYLKAEGVLEIGLAGISLGGYCSALIAALDPEHKFVIPIVPIGNLADLIEKQSRFIGSPEDQDTEKSLLNKLFSCVDPTTYSKDAGDRMTIIAGEGDRVTGIEQAKILQNHFNAPIELFEGGHLVRKGFEKVWLETVHKHSVY